MSTVHRGPLPTDHFTIVSNAWMRDEQLPWEARGLLAWLAGHAAGHDITEDAIVAAGPAGRRAVRTMIQSLESAGYLRRERRPILTGGSTVDYVLTDPRECRNSTLPKVPQQHPRADQGEQVQKQEDPQVSPKVPQQHPRSLIEDQKKNKKTSSSTAQRGTRVPDDFMPDDKMRAWYAAERLQGLIDGRVEHERFMDYWRAVPGARGVKLDWPATWRNWMRSAADRAPRRPVSGPPGNSVMPHTGAMPGAYRPSTTDQKVAQTLELGRRLQQQMEEKA
jgi:hypothetical protein